MPAPITMVLTSGGLRSLVATALTASNVSALRLVLLHVRDPRASAQVRQTFARRQALHFRAAQWVETELPPLRTNQPPQPRHAAASQAAPESPGAGAGPGPGAKARTTASASPDVTPLLRARLLLTAISAAAELGVERLVWPVSCNGDFTAAANAAEQLETIRQLVDLSGLPGDPGAIAIETPLLDLSDRQLIELGAQMEVPWDLAWSCTHPADRPCRMCVACRRRRAAFDSAGIVDGAEYPVGSRV